MIIFFFFSYLKSPIKCTKLFITNSTDGFSIAKSKAKGDTKLYNLSMLFSCKNGHFQKIKFWEAFGVFRFVGYKIEKLLKLIFFSFKAQRIELIPISEKFPLSFLYSLTILINSNTSILASPNLKSVKFPE